MKFFRLIIPFAVMFFALQLYAVDPDFTGQQPESQIVAPICSASFTSNPSGTIIDRYQWRMSTDGGTNWTEIVDDNQYYFGATTTALELRTLSEEDGYEFQMYVVVGSSTFYSSSATITLTHFTDTEMDFTGLKYSALAWADFNNDNWLDAVVCGYNASGTYTKIYKNIAVGGGNTSRTFQELSEGTTGLPPISNGDLYVSDFNNDENLDIVFVGAAPSGLTFTVFTGNADFTFDHYWSHTLGMHYSSVACGDLDRDGLADIAANGEDESGTSWFTALKNNLNGTGERFIDKTADWGFTVIYQPQGFPPLSYGPANLTKGSVDLGDYDKDGDIDVLVTGVPTNTFPDTQTQFYRTVVFENADLGDFDRLHKDQDGLRDFAFGSGVFFDYDGDGDLDVLLSGAFESPFPDHYDTKIYESNGVFWEVLSENLESVYLNGTGIFGDFTNNGILDLFQAGKRYSYGPIAKAWLNGGLNSGAIGEFTEASGTFTGVMNESAAFGDYNKDGKLDILLAGETSAGVVTKLYKNHACLGSYDPGTPAGLTFKQLGEEQITMIWEDAADNFPAYDYLTYNLYLMSQTGTSVTVSPLSDRSTGYRRVPRRGNAGANLEWTIVNIGEGEYNWGVQSIDNRYAGSPFQSSTLTVYPLPDYYCGDCYMSNCNPSSVTICPEEDWTMTSTPCHANEWKWQVFLNNQWVDINNNLPGGSQYSGETTTAILFQEIAEEMHQTLFRMAARNHQAPISWVYSEPASIFLKGFPTFSPHPKSATVSAREGYTFWGDVSAVTGQPGWNGTISAWKWQLKLNGETQWQDIQEGANFGAVFTGTTTSKLSLNLVEQHHRTQFRLLVQTHICPKYPGHPNHWFGSNPATLTIYGNFYDIGMDLAGVSYSSSLWADFDNDGWLDILVTGRSGRVWQYPFSKIYHNIPSSTIPGASRTFSAVNLGSTTLAGVEFGHASVGDYNNDGLLDILLTGEDTDGNRIAKLYRNDNKSPFTPPSGTITYSSGTFTEVNTVFTGMKHSCSDWGDYNNDGWQDVIITGEKSGGTRYSTILYKNNGDGSFSQVTTNIENLAGGQVDWGDVDNDGDLDLLLTGINNSYQNKSYIYLNNNGSFTDSGSELEGVRQGAALFGDYNDDGLLDALIGGFYDIGPLYCTTKLYQNQGSGSFTEVDADLPAFRSGTADWGDYDNDGDQDLLMTGYSAVSNIFSIVFANETNGGSASFTNIQSSIAPMFHSSCQFGDYDKDGFLDILHTGENQGYSYARVWRNNGLDPNTRPYKPENLSIRQYTANSVHLYWEAPDPWDQGISGTETPKDALTYNIYVGTEPQFIDIMSPHSKTTADNDNGLNGLRRTVDFGNTSNSTVWEIKDLPVGGGYKWGVQSIDNAFAGSEFANGTFIIYDLPDYTNAHPASVTVCPEESVTFTSEPVNSNEWKWQILWQNTWQDVTSVNIDGVSYNGADDTRLIIDYAVEELHKISYRLGARNHNAPYTWAFSNPAAIYFKYYPDFTKHPSSATIRAEEHTFTAQYDLDNYSGKALNIQHQWQQKAPSDTEWYDVTESGYTGINDTQLVLDDPDFRHLYEYRLKVSSPVVCPQTWFVSNAATLHILPIFSDIDLDGTVFDDMKNGLVEWVDFDNDGDLDLFYTGIFTGQAGKQTRLYKNNNNNFTKFYDGNDPIIAYNKSIAWGDYDGDGDIDLIEIGSFGGKILEIYRNDPTTFTGILSEVEVAPNWTSGYTDWADFDNDGDIDAFVTGTYVDGDRTHIYFNSNGAFSRIDAGQLGLVNLAHSAADIGDVNNDGYLDIVLSGVIHGTQSRLTRVYLNNGSASFTLSQELFGVSQSSVALGDIDNDGDLDLAYCGTDGTDYYVKIYENLSGTFVDRTTVSDFTGVYNGKVALADFDNDGDIDLLVTGMYSDGGVDKPSTKLYRNDGNFNFREMGTTGLDNLSSSFAWGDYDNDGAIDVALIGLDSDDNKHTSVYRNLNALKNTPPSSPADLTYDDVDVCEHDYVTLQWNASSDNETPSNGLSYNIYISRTPFANDVKPGMADNSAANTGFRRIVRIGNAGANTSYTFTNPGSGVYYWGVQAIDAGFASSSFTSSTFSLCPKVDFTGQHPSDVTTCPGLSVSYSSDPQFAIEYIWQYNKNDGSGWQDVTDAGTPFAYTFHSYNKTVIINNVEYSVVAQTRLEIDPVTVSLHDYKFRLKAGNKCCPGLGADYVESDPATLWVYQHAAFTSHPADYFACQDGSASFTAEAASPNEGPYQWQVCYLNDYSDVFDWGAGGTGNGELRDPVSIAYDDNGNVYVVDAGNSRIQKFSSDGVYERKWGSYGSGNYQFRNPVGIAANSNTVFVADKYNFRILVYDQNGVFLRKWGQNGYNPEDFKMITAVAVDANGYVYVTDELLGVVKKFDNLGNHKVNFGSANLTSPQGVAVAANGDVFVSDDGKVKKFVKVNETTYNYSDEWTSSNPKGLDVDMHGNVFVVDEVNDEVKKFNKYKDNTADLNSGQLNLPLDVAVTQDGKTAFVCSYGGDEVVRYSVEWQDISGGGDYSGYTNTILNVNSNITLKDQSEYRLANIIDGCPDNDYSRSYSNSATLTVAEEPAFTGQPADATACEGDNAYFAVSLTNQNEIKWEFSTNNGSNWADVTDNGEYSGSETVNLTVSLVDFAKNNFYFRAKARNHGCPADWENSSPASLTVVPEPTITFTGPETNTFMCEDGSADFEMSVSPEPSQTYIYDFKWQRKTGSGWNDISGYPFSGTDTRTLSILDGNGIDSADQFRLLVRINDCPAGDRDGYESPVITVNHILSPVFVNCYPSPESIYACEEYGVSFSFSDADISNDNTYQWQYAKNEDFTLAFTIEDAPGYGTLDNPSGIAFGPGNVLYVVDSGKDRIMKFDADGSHLLKFGEEGLHDGQFQHPYGIAVDPAGNVWVTDKVLHRITKFDSGGNFQTNWGSQGPGIDQVDNPSGIAADENGNVYVADTDNDRIMVTNSSGNYLRNWAVTKPRGIKVYNGYVYVTHGNDGFKKFDKNGSEISISDKDFGSNLRLFDFGPFGYFYAADKGGGSILKRESDGTSQVTATANPSEPVGAAVNHANNYLYITDHTNDRVEVYSPDWEDISDNSVFSGSQTRTLAISDPTGMHGWYFRLRASNTMTGHQCPSTWVSSCPATLEVHEQPVFATAAYNQTVCYQWDGSSTYTINMEVNPATTYQWKWFDGSVWEDLSSDDHYSGVNTPDLSIAADYNLGGDPDLANQMYRLEVQNNGCPDTWAKSGVVTLHFEVLPYFDQQPADVTACAGESATFFASATFTTGGGLEWQYRDLLDYSTSQTFGGYGYDQGQFEHPIVIAVDGEGYVYITDSNPRNHRIQKFTPDGQTVIDEFGEFGVGYGQFYKPYGIAVTPDGNEVYITDRNNHRVQVFARSSGTYGIARQWGGLGSGSGQFNKPRGIDVFDYAGQRRVIVADQDNNRVQVFDANGNYITEFNGSGSAGGEFENPTGLAIDGIGFVYVVDHKKHIVQKWVTYDGGNTFEYYDQIGTGYSRADGQFSYPEDVDHDKYDNIYVIERESPDWSRIQKFDHLGNHVKSFGYYGNEFGQFNLPKGIGVSPANNWIYVSDSLKNRVQIFGYPWKKLESSSSFTVTTGMTSGTVYIPDVTNMDGFKFRLKAWNDANCCFDFGCSNPSSTVYSDEAELTVPNEPVFFSYNQPVSVTVCETYPAVFTSSPYYSNEYVWERLIGNTWMDITDTPSYSGINSNTLTVINTIYNGLHKAVYRMVARNSGCPRTGVPSDPVTLSIIPIPIIPDPPDATVCIGEDYTYSMPNIVYSDTWRWQGFSTADNSWTDLENTTMNNVTYSGVYTTQLIIQNANLDIDYSHFRIKAKHEGCPPSWQYSEASRMLVPEEPDFSGESPSNHTACINFTYYLNSNPDNANEYLWQIKDGGVWTDLYATGPGGVNYNGFQTTELTIVNPAPLAGGTHEFRMKARNEGCPRTWNMSHIRTVKVPLMPAADMADATVCENYGITLAPVSWSNANEFQWQIITSDVYNENNFEDVQSSSYAARFTDYTTPNLDLSMADYDMNGFWFRLTMRNDGCPISWYESAPMQLTVRKQPVITGLSPMSTSVCEDEVYNVTATVIDGNLFEWEYSDDNGQNYSLASTLTAVSGASTVNLSVGSVTTSMNGWMFRIKAKNISCPSTWVTSEAATLLITPKPQFYKHPQSVTVYSGNHTFTAAASPADTYRWEIMYPGGTWAPVVSSATFSGVNQTALTITDITKVGTTVYRLGAKYMGCNTTWTYSNEATLYVPRQFVYQDDIDNLVQLCGSAGVWGDYDNDGWLDLLVSGASDSGTFTKIYRNNGDNSFTETFDLTGVYNSSAAWGDYDNDGYIDVLLSGNTGSGVITKIYRNTSGTGFTDISAALTGIESGNAEWGDYDNDGDLDIVLTGNSASGTFTAVYRNDGAGVFTDINVGLTECSNSDVQWGDYDNDGRLDILLTGESSSGKFAKIYRNTGGSFAGILAAVTEISHSASAWGDYDQDGDLDFIITGDNGTNLVTRLYRNDGGGNFTEINPGITGLKDGHIAWGDYDNDGDFDIVILGLDNSATRRIELYRNDNGTFNIVPQAVSGLTTDVANGEASFGDYDNDGDIDLIVTGCDDSNGRFTGVYKNIEIKGNTPPSAPDNLSVNLSSCSSASFTWSQSSDDNTDSDGLSYNIVISKQQDWSDMIVSPMAWVTSNTFGFRRVARLGNTNMKNGWTVEGLDIGTYYWSVQAIDNAFLGSPFASAQVFHISYQYAGTHPEDATVCENDSHIFQAGPTNANTYRWYMSTDNGISWAQLADGGTYSGVQTVNLTIDHAVPALSGNLYRLYTRFDNCPSSWNRSNPAELTVTQIPDFTGNQPYPANATVCIGDEYNVWANPANADEFQWQIWNGSIWEDMAGENSNTFTISAVDVSNDDSMYRLKARNMGCPDSWIFSESAHLRVPTNPEFGSYSTSITVCDEDNAYITVDVSNANDLQWMIKQGAGYVSLTNATYYSGVKTNSLTILNVSSTFSGNQYKLYAQNDGCPVPPAETNDIILYVTDLPEFTVQPADTRICSNVSTVLTSKAEPADQYKWQKGNDLFWVDLTDNTVYNGINNTALTINDPTDLNGWYFRLSAKNSGCPLTWKHSDRALLTVIGIPDFTNAQLPNTTICYGDSHTFISTPEPADEYQWQIWNVSTWENLVSGGAYTGVDDTKFIINNVDYSYDGSRYRLLARNNGCPPTWEMSDPFEIVVPRNPEFSPGNQPFSATACLGGEWTFTAAPDYTDEYQWQFYYYASETWFDLPNTGIYSGTNTSALYISDIEGVFVGRYNLYRLLVRHQGCPASWIYSNEVSLFVPQEPDFTDEHPVNATACEGDRWTFTSDPENANVFKWQVNEGGGWIDITNGGYYSGAQSKHLIIDPLPVGTRQFRLLAQNDGCPQSWARSNPAELFVPVTPVFTNHPQSRTLCDAAGVTFTASATNVSQYRWQQYTNVLGVDRWENITDVTIYSGAGTNTLVVSDLSGFDEITLFRLTAVNDGCPDPYLASNVATLYLPERLTFAGNHPSDATVCESNTHQFASQPVNALDYQWQVNNGGGWIDITNNAVYDGVESTLLTINDVSGLNGNYYRLSALGGGCPTTWTHSNAARLRVPPAPDFTGNHPQNQIICLSGSAAFESNPANANQFLWQKFNNNIWVDLNEDPPDNPYTGVTTTRLVISDVSGLNNARYRLRAKNDGCPDNWVISNEAALIISTEPDFSGVTYTDATVCINETHTFTIDPADADEYQWVRIDGGTPVVLSEGSEYSGVTTESLIVTKSASGNYEYKLRARYNGCPSTWKVSESVYLEVTADPDFSGVTYTDATVCLKEEHIFTVSPSNADKYQWIRIDGGTPVVLSNNAGYTGVNTQSLTVNKSSAGDFEYRLRAKNNNCPSSWAESLSMYLMVLADPDFTGQQPADATICENGTHTFSSNPSNANEYRWEMWNGSSFDALTSGEGFTGYDSPDLTVSDPSLLDMNGEMLRLGARNNGCPASWKYSELVNLSFEMLPSLEISPASQTVCINEQGTVELDADEAASYTWQKKNGSGGWDDLTDGTNYSGTDHYILTFSNLAEGQHEFRAIIGSRYCPERTSNTALVYVTLQPVFTDHPENATVDSGDGHTFSASATNAASYKWQYLDGSSWSDLNNGGVYSGVMTENLTISDVDGLDGTTYRLTARNGNCPWVSSNSATLTVPQPQGSVTLVSPSNSNTITSLTPTLVWDSDAINPVFRVQVADDQNFNNIIFSNNNVTSENIALPSGTLSWEETYYWRVSIGSGTFTPAWWFQTHYPSLTISIPDVYTCPNSSATLGGINIVTGGSGSYTYSWTPSAGLNDATISNPVISNATQTTTFTLSVIDQAVPSRTFTEKCVLTVYPQTNVTITRRIRVSKGDYISLGNYITSLSGAPPISYEWRDKDDNLISTDPNPSVEIKDHNAFEVTIWDGAGCGSDSDEMGVIALRISGSELSEEDIDDLMNGNSVIRVYPNPTSSVINVEAVFPEKAKVEFTLIDLPGRVLQRFSKEDISSYEGSVDLTDYPSGSYTLIISVNGRNYTQKIIKQ